MDLIENEINEIEEIEEKIKDLSLEMFNIFQSKQKEKFNLWEDHRVLKGRISQTSNDFESLLAMLLSELDKRPNIYYLIDYCISIKSKSARTKNIYPDIVVIREEGMPLEEVMTSSKRKNDFKLVVERIFELKIDLAYDDPGVMEKVKKEKEKDKQKLLYQEAYAKNNFLSRHIERLYPFLDKNNYEFSYKHRYLKNNTIKEKKLSLEISDDFQWYCILLTSANDHLDKISILKRFIKRNKITNFSILLNEHANQKERDLNKEEVKFNPKGIKNLAEFIYKIGK